MNKKTSVKNKGTMTDEEGEVRELTRDDMREFRPLGEVLPELGAVIAKRKPGSRGPQKAPTKIAVTLRLDGTVIEFFRATGKGWQSRINDALKKAVNDES